MANLQVRKTTAPEVVYYSVQGSSAVPIVDKPVFKANTSTVANEDSYSGKNKKFYDTMSKYLNIPVENLSVHYDKKGNKYLKISRPAHSNKSEKELYKLGKIKKDLKLKDYVLYNANGKRQGISATTGEFDATTKNMDSLSIASGHYLLVPFSEIGKKQEVKGIIFKEYYDTPENIELKEAVKQYQD